MFSNHIFHISFHTIHVFFTFIHNFSVKIYIIFRLSYSSDLIMSFNSVIFRHLTIGEPKFKCIFKIQDCILSSIRSFLRSEGFIEILAPIIGPCTDPGIRGAKQASIDYYGSKFKVMSSMILYKQMMIKCYPKIFALSPNIRIEPLEAVSTGRHLVEFRQIDLEVAYAKCEDMFDLAERLLKRVIDDVLINCSNELKSLGRELAPLKIPFKRYTYDEAVKLLSSMGYHVNYGYEIPWDAEEVLSFLHKEPFWITNYPISARGFYYLEDESRPGFLRDFDLMYPEGYGEAISGGEREYRYEFVVERMKRSGEDPSNYNWYLEMLKDGIPPSAGFGIGVERLTRYICGLKYVWDAVPFPKIPGVVSP
jgi:asparaginyl-tRNA synthetase